MKARMEKYESAPEVKQRTKRNERLYSEVQNMNIDYVNIDVNNAIDLSLSNNSRSSREDYQKQRELDKILPRKQEIDNQVKQDIIPKEERVYDIDEILKMARENKLFEESEKKRLINTEYNILTKLDVHSLQNDEMRKEDLRSLIDNIYEKEKPVKEKKYPRKVEERLLSDLFEDTTEEKKDLEEEIRLKEELSQKVLAKQEDNIKDDNKDDIIVIEPKKESQSLEDKKEEKDEEIMEDFIEEKEGKGLLIAIIVVSILIILTCGFFVYEYFFGL
ncbi:MAG: hypothetical protein ACI4PE_03485 [Bacilli bacterium]